MVPDFDVFIILFPLNADWNVGGDFCAIFHEIELSISSRSSDPFAYTREVVGANDDHTEGCFWLTSQPEPPSLVTNCSSYATQSEYQMVSLNISWLKKW